jgi:hypothetical protein
VCGVFDVSVVCRIAIVGTIFGNWFSLYVAWSKKVDRRL